MLPTPDEDGDAGVISRILDSFPVDLSVPDEQMLENVRSAMTRGLPEVRPAPAHGRVMSIAAGGPSLADTWRQLDGVIVTTNGSLGFLLERDVKPWACGVFDPRPHMADIVEADPDVLYFLGSTCHPTLFDKLKGCRVGIWHPLGMAGIEEAAKGATCFIGGGGTIGLRWLNIGHVMGFRKFHAHGLDSSFRGEKTHAYPDYRDGMQALNLFGYQTTINFIEQVRDWFLIKAMFSRMPVEEQPEIKLFGDGLLQFYVRQRDKPVLRQLA